MPHNNPPKAPKGPPAGAPALTEEDFSILNSEIPLPSTGGYREDFELFFEKWLEEFQVKPGRNPTICAGDIYRHFVAWVEEQGLELPPVPKQRWGRAFKVRGFGGRRFRTVADRKDRYLIMLSADASAYFRNWLRLNGSVPAGQGPFRRPLKENK